MSSKFYNVGNPPFCIKHMYLNSWFIDFIGFFVSHVRIFFLLFSVAFASKPRFKLYPSEVIGNSYTTAADEVIMLN